MTATLRHDLVGLGLVLAAVGAILALAEVARRHGRWETEHTRKVAHVGSGLVAAAFPWLFSSAFVVGLLCGGFAAFMAVTAGRGFLPAVHAVPRRTWGGVLFPFGVALAFAASARPAPFVAAVLALALGDATAALVGRRCGRHAYRFGGATRSVEGSAALFLTTAVIVAATLRLLDRLALHEAVAWALAVAALATAVEAAAQDGSDNLLLPVAVALALAPAAGAARGDALVLVAVAATVLASLLEAARQPGARPTGGRRRVVAVTSPFARVLGVRPAAFVQLVRAGGPW
jgi:phytol kinase